MSSGKAADVAVIVAAAVVKGKPLPLPDKSVLGAGATAVLFVSQSCRYCTENMPFYKQLSAARKARGFSMVAVVPNGREPREDGVALFAEHGISVDVVFSLRFADVGVKAVWTGALSTDEQTEVLSRVNSLLSAHKAG
jgi:hypothetical protein